MYWQLLRVDTFLFSPLLPLLGSLSLVSQGDLLLPFQMLLQNEEFTFLKFLKSSAGRGMRGSDDGERTKGFSRLVLPVLAACSCAGTESAEPASKELLELWTPGVVREMNLDEIWTFW